MKRFNLEIVVGLFMLLGFASVVYLSVKLGDVSLFDNDHYRVKARFGSVSGLKLGASVQIGGVDIGKVATISLDPKSYDAVVTLDIKNGIELQDDCIASVRTSGIIGDRYISILPGGSPMVIEEGGEIFETESAINLEELLSKYIFENN
ncbi:outer membrane lipid asymmetry maintenance protein MlaD [Desulfuromonas acetoxidans]|uniref:outer membrane lipid asymmetry maintenance protein MlaD n=1 Tax=Desulfuromonas acetoxidans TaxID=891 RepID=UPI002931C9A0|nr:outer membrane lipid asymmetry maintenance protein MlaD [Desulfuromonas acetoxidans]